MENLEQSLSLENLEERIESEKIRFTQLLDKYKADINKQIINSPEYFQIKETMEEIKELLASPNALKGMAIYRVQQEIEAVIQSIQAYGNKNVDATSKEPVSNINNAINFLNKYYPVNSFSWRDCAYFTIDELRQKLYGIAQLECIPAQTVSDAHDQLLNHEIQEEDWKNIAYKANIGVTYDRGVKDVHQGVGGNFKTRIDLYTKGLGIPTYYGKKQTL